MVTDAASTVHASTAPSVHDERVLYLIVAIVFGLIVALVMAALASWTHLVTAFGAVESSRSSVTPTLSASAVEVGLLALAVSGALLAVLSGKYDDLITGSTAFFAVVSFLANVYAALEVRLPKGVTVDAVNTLTWLDWTVVVVGAGVLPIMVVVLTHVIMRVCRGGRDWWTQTEPKTDGTTVAGESKTQTAAVDAEDSVTWTQTPSPSPSVVMDFADGRREGVFLGRSAIPMPPTDKTPADVPADPVAAYIAAHGAKHVSEVAPAVGIGRAKLYDLVKTGAAVGWRIDKGIVRAA